MRRAEQTVIFLIHQLDDDLHPIEPLVFLSKTLEETTDQKEALPIDSGNREMVKKFPFPHWGFHLYWQESA
jgi:hypothetical protein